VIKPEWGSKHSCPRCATRFYDMGKADPVTCINCGYAWTPEPILKSKQPLPFQEQAPQAGNGEIEDADLLVDDADLDVEDDDESTGDVSIDDDDADLADVVDPNREDE